MLRRWALMLLGSVEKSREHDPKQRKQLALSNIGVQVRASTVRIVHPGGKVQVYRQAILAGYLMESYPGMQVTRPDVFKRPLDSVLSAETYLFPGNKYYLVPSTTLEKLKRRYLQKLKMKQMESKQPILAIKDVSDVGSEISEESLGSAKDYYICNENWSDSLVERTRKEKPFVPPIQKPRIRKEEDWEPSLTSIQELSP